MGHCIHSQRILHVVHCEKGISMVLANYSIISYSIHGLICGYSEFLFFFSPNKKNASRKIVSTYLLVAKIALCVCVCDRSWWITPQNGTNLQFHYQVLYISGKAFIVASAMLPAPVATMMIRQVNWGKTWDSWETELCEYPEKKHCNSFVKSKGSEADTFVFSWGGKEWG